MHLSWCVDYSRFLHYEGCVLLDQSIAPDGLKGKGMQAHSLNRNLQKAKLLTDVLLKLFFLKCVEHNDEHGFKKVSPIGLPCGTWCYEIIIT